MLGDISILLFQEIANPTTEEPKRGFIGNYLTFLSWYWDSRKLFTIMSVSNVITHTWVVVMVMKLFEMPANLRFMTSISYTIICSKWQSEAFCSSEILVKYSLYQYTQ